MTDKTDEEITIDFSWIKSLFSKKNKKIIKSTKSTKSKGKDLEDEITLDFKNILKIISKYSIIFLILIPLFISMQIRLLPAELPMAEDWARGGINNNIRNTVAQQVNAQYPHLATQEKENEINRQVNIITTQQKDQIEQAVKSQSVLLKDRFKDENGETYLGDIDSYFWARYTRNIIEKGTIADETRDGEFYDNHMQAPTGYPIIPNFYPYFEAYLYKFLRIFNPKITILRTAYLTPMFLSFIAIIAAFFIGKKLSGNLAGFMAAVLIAVNPTVLSRSFGSDNDIVNAVFPLVIMLFTIYAFDSKNYKKTIVFSIITGLITGFYSIAWSGWWFMLLFILGSGIIYIGYIGIFELISKGKTFDNLLKNKKIKLIFLLLIIFLSSTFVSLAFLGKQAQFLNVFIRNPSKIINIQQASRGTSIWPNVYTTVAELNAANFNQVIGSLGGKLFLWLALIGTLLALINYSGKSKKKNWVTLSYIVGSSLYFLIFIEYFRLNTINIFVMLGLLTLPMFVGLLLSAIYSYEIEPIHSILMAIWFMATIYASTKGVRFILLIIPAFVISFSTFIGFIVSKFSKMISNGLDVNEAIPKVIFALLALSILLQPIAIGKQTARQYAPSINDAWVESLTKIKDNSNENAIINSWWDFGHWFKYWADRAVTFDGASQNSQRAHWIGKVLLTNDEDVAVGILRMLDCGGTAGETEVSKLLDNRYDSVELVNKFLKMEQSEVKEALLKLTSQEKADEIISYFFCKPPENFFITSQDMVGKSGVWAHFGSWNFERASVYNYFKSGDISEFSKKVIDEFGYTEESAKQTYYQLASFVNDRQINDWIAPWPSYGGIVGCPKIDNSTLQCNIPASSNQVIPMQINLTTMEASVNVNGQEFHPNSFGYLNNGELIVKDYDENGIGYGILLLDGNNVLFMSNELTSSMFTRLFYLNGEGLTHFKKFHDVVDVGGSRIITWKIEW